MRAEAAGVHGGEPLFERVILGAELGRGRLVPAAVEVDAAEIKTRAAAGDAVFVREGQNVVGDVVEVGAGGRGVGEDGGDEALDYPVAAGFPRVGAGAEEDAVRGALAADADDFERTVFDRAADDGEGDEWMRTDAREQFFEVAEAVGFDAGDVERAGGAEGDAEAYALFDEFHFFGAPRVAVVGEEAGGAGIDGEAGGAVPDVEEILEDEGMRRAGFTLETEVPMPGGAIGGVALVVVLEGEEN